MRVLIVDDEPLARSRLAALLRDCADVTVVGSVGDGESAFVAINHLAPDALLLDINMPGLSGTALAQRLAGQARPQIIFCTADQAHALHAFELDAVDYLLKPVRLERLRDALQRAERRLVDHPPETESYLRGRLRGEEVRIALSEVICLTADEKYVVVQHRNGELLIEDSLRQLENSYPDRLIRLHRNCLVPPARLLGIRALGDGRVLARLDGTDASPEISRRNLPAVRKLLRLG